MPSFAGLGGLELDEKFVFILFYFIYFYTNYSVLAQLGLAWVGCNNLKYAVLWSKTKQILLFFNLLIFFGRTDI